MFTQEDHRQIDNHGLTPAVIEGQIAYFKKGFPPTKLARPATIGDGILQLEGDKLQALKAAYSDQKSKLDIVKFVPASGAASRMFKTLFAFVEEYTGSEADYEKLTSNTGKGSVFEFLKHLEDFAFHEDLANVFDGEGKSLNESHVKREYKEIVSKVLLTPGLNYGKLPKGLLKFHLENGKSKTPVEEHIIEGCQYAKKDDGSVSIHFTVSPEHMEPFKSHVESIRQAYESKYDCKLKISYSVQNPGTDTIAVNLDNTPFRNGDNSLLFRPAGHGALLQNLDEIDADVIFLKNIDNVVPDRLKEETILYKEVIGGLLLELKEKIDAILNDPGSHSADDIRAFAKESLGYEQDGDASKEDLLKVLDRPIRVCGMVRNQGDPGGGPFWVEESDGSRTLQIVETAQIDLNDTNQDSILKQSTHFNPVDVVCSVKNHKGEKYNLMDYRDPDAGFATEKSKDGKTLKAQELPGLWNGSMAFWNTIFVEVPIITFNPVKTVNDLLKDQHKGEV